MDRRKKYQAKMKAQNKCVCCGKKATKNKKGKISIYCKYHLEYQRNFRRKKKLEQKQEAIS